MQFAQQTHIRELIKIYKNDYFPLAFRAVSASVFIVNGIVPFTQTKTTMKIRITQTCQLLPYGKEAIFHKGKIYQGTIAFNQPGWFSNQMVFAKKAKGHSILLQKGDYEIIDGTFAYYVEREKENTKTVSYSEYLQLPEDWIATRFFSGIELSNGFRTAFIPMPYETQSKDWWIEQARIHIKERAIEGNRQTAKDKLKY